MIADLSGQETAGGGRPSEAERDEAFGLFVLLTVVATVLIVRTDR
jgi:hypothetical protein